MSSRRGRLLAAALIGACAAFLATAPAPASAAGAARPGAACVLLAQDPGADGTVAVKEVCGTAATRAIGANGVEPIITLYEDAGFRGPAVQTLYGGFGTCDREGYTFELSDWWKGHLSSYRLHGLCWWSWYKANNIWRTGSYGHIGDVHYVGDYWNDNVFNIHTWSR